MPKRIKLGRTLGWRMPPNARKVDRSTRYGNPYGPKQIGICITAWGLPAPILPLREPPSLERALDLYTAHTHTQLEHDPDFFEPLRGYDLGCWCKLCDRHKHGKPFLENCPDCAPCHADIVGRIANFERGDLTFTVDRRNIDEASK